jgi:hypothetical protein
VKLNGVPTQKGMYIRNGNKVMIKWVKNRARSNSSEREWLRAKLNVFIK